MMYKNFIKAVIFIFLISTSIFFSPNHAVADQIYCGMDLSIDPAGSYTVWSDWWAGSNSPAIYDVYIDFLDGSGSQLVGKFSQNGDPSGSHTTNEVSGATSHTYASPGTKYIQIRSGPGCNQTFSIDIPTVITSNPMGTICVASNVPTSWVVSGPGGAHGATGLTSDCFDDTAGAWTIGSIPTLAGYTGPVLTPSTNVQNVPDGGAISWTITYSQNKYRCSGGGSCILDNVNGDTTSSNCNNSCSVSAAPTVTISASPSSITSGQSSVVSWISQNASSCSVTPNGWTGTSGSQSTGALFSTTNYIVTCSGPGGTVTNSATVNVGTVGGPTVNVSASPTGVTTGGSSIISWSIAGTVTSCSASGGWTTPGTLSGSVVAGPLFSNTTFGLSCTGPGGTASDSATVTVSSIPPTKVTLTASPINVTSGQSSTLTWDITGNPTACSASGAWTTPGTFSGSKSTGALSSSQTYGLTCSGPGGTASDSASVTVSNSPSSVNIKGWGPPSNTVTDGPVSITLGSTGGVSWTSTNATDCQLYQNGVFTGWTGTSQSSVGVGPITAPTTYQVNCSNGTDTSSDSVVFNPVGVPSVTLKGWGPPSVPQSAPVTGSVVVSNGSSGGLVWTSSSVTGCRISRDGTDLGAYPVNDSAPVGPITSTQTHTITCDAVGGGQVSSSFTHSTVALTPDLTAGGVNPTSATVGSALTFSGTVTNIGSGSISGTFNNLFQVWPPSAGTPSTLSVNPISSLGSGSSKAVTSSAYTFTLSGSYNVRLCADLDSSFSGTISENDENNNCGPWTSVTVSNPVSAPSITLSALPTSVVSGGSSTLTWNVVGTASSCTASGGWSGSKSTTGGNQLIGSITTDTTYTLTCTGPGGTDVQAVTVTVTNPPTVTLSASPTSVASGGSSTLTWTTTGSVSSCTASGGWSGAKSVAGGSQSTGTISGTTTYNISCTGPGGTSSDSVTVSITPGPVVTLSASPTSVASGGSTTLTWTVSGSVSSCTASGSASWSGAKSTSGGSQTISGITTDLTFTLSCSGPGGTTVQSVTVTVISAPTVTLTATPTSVASGGSSNLSWSTSGNITSCTASGGWSGAKSASGGSQSTGPISASTTYTLTCTGPGGTSSDTVTINITAGPVITLSATPASVASGGSTNLGWTVSGSVSSCTASGGWSGSKSTTGGTQSSGALSSDTVFTLSCSGPGGTTVQSVTVSVFNAPVVSLTASPTSVGVGGASNLTWTVSGAVDSCTASGGWSGSKATTGGNQSTGSISASTTYTLNCTGPGGSSSDTVTVNITSGPVVTLTASPTNVSSGGSSTLTWSVSGQVNSCTASGPSSWSGTKSITGGNQTITNITTDTTFTLSCTGPGGTTVQSQTVTVSSAPSVNLVATPSSVSTNSPFVLTWTVTDADTCTATGGWSGGKSNTGGNQTIPGITSATAYTLTCTGSGGTRSDSVTVNITSGPVITLSVSPTTLNPGDTTNISWTVSGTVTSCTASGGWSGSKVVTGGTEVSGPINADTTFTLSCTGPGGTTSQSATATVIGTTLNFPNAPTISGTATYTNTMYTFNISGTDSAGESVRYGIDWNMDGVADNWLPAPPPVTYVTSGTSQSIAHSWSTPGTYTFQALTQNNISGLNSGWTTKTVTVADMIVNANGQCGTANGQAYAYGSSSFAPFALCSTSYGTTPASVSFPTPGNSVSWSCKGSGTGVNSPMCTASQNQATADVTVNVVSYGGSVSGPGIVNCTGTCSTTVTVGSSITLTATPTSSYWQFNGWDVGNSSGVCYAFGKTRTCTFTVTSSGSVTITASFGARIFDYKEF